MFSLFLTGIRSIGNLTVFAHAFHQPARLWKYYIAPLQRKQIFYCKGVFFMTYNISGRKQNLTLQRCNCTPYLKRDIDIPANCTIISEKTFQNRSMIQSVSFPYGLKQIGSNAFSGCSRLKHLLLPESLCQIGSIFRLYHFILYLYPSTYFHNFKGHAPQRPQIIRNSFFQWKQAA